jgi:hypothetical protein
MFELVLKYIKKIAATMTRQQSTIETMLERGDMEEIAILTTKVQELEGQFAFWHTVSVGFLAAVVIVGILSYIFQYWAGETSISLGKAKDELRLAKERKSEEIISSTNQKAAEANARAEEARLELAKFKTWRSLTEQQHIEFIADMKRFAGVNFDISGGNGEEMGFAINIARALDTAGWNWVDWTEGGLAWNFPGVHFRVGLMVTRGVHIQIFDRSLLGAQDALAKSLRNAGFDGITTTLDASPPDHPRKYVMHIHIGPKP